MTPKRADYIEELLKTLVVRITRIEKQMGKEFHGHSGYTHGCRCRVCRDAKTQHMRVYRAKHKRWPKEETVK